MVAGWSYMLTCNLQTAARERTIWWVCLILGPYLALYFINFSSFHCLEKKNYDFSIDFRNILMDLEKKNVLSDWITSKMDQQKLLCWVSPVDINPEKTLWKQNFKVGGSHFQIIQFSSNFVEHMVRQQDKFPQILVRNDLVVPIFFWFLHLQSSEIYPPN